MPRFRRETDNLVAQKIELAQGSEFCTFLLVIRIHGSAMQYCNYRTDSWPVHTDRFPWRDKALLDVSQVTRENVVRLVRGLQICPTEC